MRILLLCNIVSLAPHRVGVCVCLNCDTWISQAPATDGGKIFLMVYALIGIPVVGVCVGVLASQLLGVLEYLLRTINSAMIDS